MKISVAALLLADHLPVNAASMFHHKTRQVSAPSSPCCFKLDSAGIVSEDVQEDHTGHLHLSGGFQEGGFCLQDGKIQDGLGNQCFLRSPNYQLECYQKGVVGDTVFDIVAADNSSSSSSNGTFKLVYDGGPGTYLACSANNGQSYEIYSTSKPDQTGCLEVSLILTGQTGQCSLNSVSVPQAGGSEDGCEGNGTATDTRALSSSSSEEEAVEDSTSSAAAATTTTTTCSIAPSAPSLAPRKIGHPDDTSPDGTGDTGADASITAVDSTIFHFSIPQNFASSSPTTLCALQFRIPFCSDLPDGYPCFNFSGLEQELLSDSGMIVSQISGGDEWDNTALQQVNPGSNVILGTFPCSASSSSSATAPYGSDGDSSSRDVAWLASSVRDFSLQFEQAGVGSSKFEDGVGAFIVQCS